ncbi:MAG: YkgJ family cysteine cluster protein, partial [Candidatus Sericytochromatia bacterium]|nr:YkgJ family cysteine cluster protein [Candidatus Tanganyikabacteria bacterium]
MGDRVERRSAVEDGEFADVMSQIRVLRPDAPDFELLGVKGGRVGQDIATIRMDLRDRRCDRSFQALAAFDDEGLLGACVCEGGQSEDADPLLVEALIAAEFAQLPASLGPDVCRSGLELSYERVFGAADFLGPHEIPLRWLPEARFSCAMCGESCRASKWRNSVTDGARQALEAIPWRYLRPQLAGKALTSLPEGVAHSAWRGDFELAVGHDGWCVFYDPQVGCAIHGVLGRQPLTSCHQFPFSFTRTPDGVDVWATYHCHAALYGLGGEFADREADIRSRLWAGRVAQRSVGHTVPLRADRSGPRVSWEVYRAIEAELLDWLEPSSAEPLEPRLQAAEAFVAALCDAPPETADGILELARAQRQASRLTRPPSQRADPLVEGLTVGMFKRYPPLPGAQALPGEGLSFLIGSFGAPDWQAPGRTVARYLRHCLFHKHFLQSEGVRFTWRMVLLSHAIVRTYAWAQARLAAEGYLRVAPLASAVAALPEGANPALPFYQKAIQD